MRVFRLPVLVAAATLFYGCSASPPPDADQPPSQDAALDGPDPDRVRGIVDGAIRPILEEHDVPGMAVAVTVGGVPHFFNYGVAAREGGGPVTEETLFELGSVSKTFTATLGSYARATGRLSLDDPPGRFLPELQGSPVDGVTLLHLGSYTAGSFPLQFPDGVSDEAGMIRYFREWQPEAPPGTERRYSNPSIGLFGRAAALALEGDFAGLVESRILEPLGLNQTHFAVPEEAMTRYAWGHNAAGDLVRVNPGMFDAEAYGLKSTASDMIRFVQWNLDPSGLDGPLRQAIEGTHLGHFRVGDMVQGLGWEQYPFPVELDRILAGNSTTMSMQDNAVEGLTLPQAPSSPTLFNKTGSTGGFGAYVAFIPEHDVGVVMLANRNFPNAARVEAVYTILEQLLGEGR
jgi:beta-lactamase class C